MDELEAIFDKLRKCMAGRVSESVLIELDVAEIKLQQVFLRELAKVRQEYLELSQSRSTSCAGPN